MIARYAIPFFFIMGLIVVPIVLSFLCRWLAPRKYWRKIAVAITILIWSLVLYGHFFGYRQIEVHHVTYVFQNLPASFDGYRIVHFSDAHVGTATGDRQQLLRNAIDSINSLHPDMIVFTGDLQNLSPQEIAPQASLLSQLKARDGVYSVMGNHDYPTYLDVSDMEKELLTHQTEEFERKMGWRLLLNEHAIIHRDSDSIVIAGMENWGKVKRMPRRGDVAKTIAPYTRTNAPFMIMLQHDPTCWQEHILPECNAQLTLSGHTHGGQVNIFGWSPAALSYNEWGGSYEQNRRYLYVSTGLGALIPFRLNAPGEIVLIELKTEI